MTRIIGAALIALALAGCAGGENLIGETAWSKNYWKIEDAKPKGGA
jgi:hypothetical protein